jgi:Flp pilus assembly pilin Flp
MGFCQGASMVRLAKQSAQDVVEYGLMIGTIAIIVLLATMAFGNKIQPWFEQLAGRITTTGT